ncbi:MAG: ABC transporter permease [Candidatus Paceibacterota bacterium]|jgi:ABC-type nitrate/sulfonate/bicarbonate transport system permease component
MKKYTGSTLPVVFLLVLWELVSRSGVVSVSLFPPPTEVAGALYGMIVSGTIFIDLGDSLWRLLVGLFIGSTAGILFGLLTGRSRFCDRRLAPIIQLLRPLPPVAIIPLIIVWFGIGDGAKIFSIAFAVFFPVWINTNIGARQISRSFLWSAKLLTKSKIKIFRKVIFPASLPFIIAGIRTAIAVAFIMVFVSELAGASSGLGYRISVTSLSYRIDQMIAALIVLGALGAITDQLFVLGTKKFFPWINYLSK